MEARNKEVTLDMQGKEELLVPNTGVSKGLQPESITGIVSNETTTCEVVDKLKSWVVWNYHPNQYYCINIYSHKMAIFQQNISGITIFAGKISIQCFPVLGLQFYF